MKWEHDLLPVKTTHFVSAQPLFYDLGVTAYDVKPSQCINKEPKSKPKNVPSSYQHQKLWQ